MGTDPTDTAASILVWQSMAEHGRYQDVIPMSGRVCPAKAGEAFFIVGGCWCFAKHATLQHGLKLSRSQNGCPTDFQ